MFLLAVAVPAERWWALARRVVDSGLVWRICWCSCQAWNERAGLGPLPPVLRRGRAGPLALKMRHGVGAGAAPAGRGVGRTVQTVCDEVGELASSSQSLDLIHERECAKLYLGGIPCRFSG